MRDVYYRGCLLISQKCKYFKRNDVPPNGKWTFKGFIPDVEEFKEQYNDNDYGMAFDDQLLDFWTNINFDNLIDIRLTPSNIGYLTYVRKKKIDLNIPDYKEMNIEERIKFNNSITAYITKFFRKLIEKALTDLCLFFEQYPSNAKIL